MKRALPLVFAGLLLAALPMQTVSAMRLWAPTADELAHHVASGYSYWKTGDFRMNPASPPLPRMLSAFPLLFLGAKAPLENPSWEAGDSPAFAHQFFYESNHDPDRLIFWARFPVVLLSVIFGGVLWAVARRWLGTAAAFIALALYVFCPDILAHSGLATADLAVSLFMFLSGLSFADYLEKPGRSLAVRAGVFAGLAFLSKFSAILLFPIFLCTALAAGRIKIVKFSRILLFLGVTVFTIWAGYGFELKPLLKNTPDPAKKEAVYREIGGPALLRFAQQVPVPLSTFSSALVSMVVTRARGTHAYLLGKWSDHGWWYYYFVAFWAKNTFGFLLMTIGGLLGVVFGLLNNRVRAAALVVPVVFFFAATLGDKAQAGIRYFLPIYPLLMLMAGAFAAAAWKKGLLPKMMVLLLLAAHAGSSLAAYPDYLAYFNETVGGPASGWKILRDSNLDWGQDLKRLGDEVRRRGSPEVVLFYPWPADPASYGIRWRAFQGSEMETPGPFLYAVSAHAIDAVVWARDRKPDMFIGHTIFVYDLRPEKT